MTAISPAFKKQICQPTPTYIILLDMVEARPHKFANPQKCHKNGDVLYMGLRTPIICHHPTLYLEILCRKRLL